MSRHVRLTAAEANQPNHGRVIAVDSSQTLLVQLQQAGFVVPEACRNGNCGLCFAQLVSGRVSEIKDTATVPLCISCALSDTTLTLPPTPAWQLYACQLLDKRGENLRIKLPAGRSSLQHNHFALLAAEWASPAQLLEQQSRTLVFRAQQPLTRPVNALVHLLCVKPRAQGRYRLLYRNQTLLTGLGRTLLRDIRKSLLQSNFTTQISI